MKQADSISDAPTRGKRRVFALLTVLLAVLVVLVGAELVLRWRYRKIERITGVAQWISESGGRDAFRSNGETYPRVLGWTSLPGLRGDALFPFKLTINNQGLRATRDYAPSPASGITRIAVFGDSCVWGQWVDNDQTVPAFLETCLPGTEALNFGENSYGFGQMMLRLEQQGVGFNPDHAVFVVMLPSDVVRDRTDLYTHPKPYFDVDDAGLAVRNVPVPTATHQPWIFRHCFLAAILFGRLPDTLDRPVQADETIEVSRLILARVRATCEKHDIGLTVVTMPVARGINDVRRNAPYAPVYGMMRQAFEETGVDLLDLYGPLERGYLAHGGEWLAPDGHWNAPANRQIARWIADHLARRKSGQKIRAKD